MDEQKYLEIKNRYIQTFEQKRDDILRAREEGDSETLQTLLHKLCGSSGGYGFLEVSTSCKLLLDLMSNPSGDNDSEIEKQFQFINSVLEKEYNEYLVASHTIEEG